MTVIKVEVRVVGREVGNGFRGNQANEVLQGGGILRNCGQEPRDDVAPLMEADPIFREMTGGLAGYAKVSKEEASRMKLCNGVERLIP